MSSLFQNVINRQFTAGQAGEIAMDGPLRAKIGRILDRTDITGTVPAIGKVFGWVSPELQAPGILENQVSVGGSVFYGMASNPKEQVLYATGSDPLAASYTLPIGGVASFADMGIFFASLFMPTGATAGTAAGNVNFAVNSPLYYVTGVTVGTGIDATQIGLIVPGTFAADGVTAQVPVVTGYTFARVPAGRMINNTTAPAAGSTALSRIQLTF